MVWCVWPPTVVVTVVLYNTFPRYVRCYSLPLPPSTTHTLIIFALIPVSLLHRTTQLKIHESVDNGNQIRFANAPNEINDAHGAEKKSLTERNEKQHDRIVS